MDLKQKKSETAQGWYRRLRKLSNELRAPLREAKALASHEVNLAGARRKVEKGSPLMPSEAAALAKEAS